MVELGWVALANKRDITRGSEPLPLLTPPEEGHHPEKDLYTGFVNDPAPANENDVRPLTEVIGIVRKGEKENILIGHKNWEEEGNF